MDFTCKDRERGTKRHFVYKNVEHFYMRIPATLSSAFFAILNLLAKGFSVFAATTYCFVKKMRLLLSISSSGRADMRVKMFHTRASLFSKMDSNSIRKCMILLGVRYTGLARSTDFRIARESEKLASISATNLARFMERFSSIVSSSLK
ncbi:hypothetical protein ACMD2_12977 [Ananas comosus]|uniref:Uncharacterized protein n=1 Tax=Ananas comosus TaxID=4615 RepID=A0A199UE28_ANACO|nr:hypothetical protein ACMD2_12977 [Ananas comosus]